MINNKIIISIFFILAISGCVNVPSPSLGERVSGVSVSDYKLFKLIRSFSYSDDMDPNRTIEKLNFLKKNIEKNDMQFDVVLSHKEKSCLQKENVNLYEIIKKTIPDKEWYNVKGSVVIELVYTDERNFDISDFYINTASFYFYLDACGDRSPVRLKSLIIESVATVFHELVHVNSGGNLFPWNSREILEEEVLASSIGLCVKLLSKSVQAYEFKKVNNELLYEYNEKYKTNQVFYRSLVAELVAEEQFSKALSDEEGYINTSSKREDILHECSILNSDNNRNTHVMG